MVYKCKINKMPQKLRAVIVFRQVGVDHQTISSMFSVRAAGTVASSLLVGYLFGTSIFKNKSNGGRKKLSLLSACHTLIAVSLLAIPFVKTFPLLLIGTHLYCIQKL